MTWGRFVLRWEGQWDCTVEPNWVSPSYGVRELAQKVVFRRRGPVEPLTVVLAPHDVPADALRAWAQRAVA